MAAVVAVGVYRMASKVPAAGSLRSFDALGSLLLIVALEQILFGIQQGG